MMDGQHIKWTRNTRIGPCDSFVTFGFNLMSLEFIHVLRNKKKKHQLRQQQTVVSTTQHNGTQRNETPHSTNNKNTSVRALCMVICDQLIKISI